MHLNYECLRDVLIVLEKLLTVRNDDVFEFCAVSLDALLADPDIVGYLPADVFYVVHNLHQAGFIEAHFVRSGVFVHEAYILDITYAGHMFLRNIKDMTIWSMLRKKCGPAFTASLPVLQQLAGDLIRQHAGG